jgi:hypothetical protein
MSKDAHHTPLMCNLDDFEALFSKFPGTGSRASTAHPSLHPLDSFPVTLLPFPRQFDLAFPPLGGHLLTKRNERASLSTS